MTILKVYCQSVIAMINRLIVNNSELWLMMKHNDWWQIKMTDIDGQQARTIHMINY